MPSCLLKSRIAIVAAASVALISPIAKAEEKIQFLHVLDDEPIEFKYRTNQKITDAVKQFHKTAKNPYSGNDAAIADGKKLYGKLCKACHLKDGTGRIGPNLVDGDWIRPRTNTEKGRFEIIYAGGAGAMQAFGRRIDQDDILKVMAYVDSLPRKTN